MKVPLRTTPQHPLRKVIAAALIAMAAVAMSIAASHLPGARVAMSGLDTTLYDAFYRFRNPEDRTTQPIVIVAVDEASLRKLSLLKYRWPWSRDIWASTVKYLQACGARAVVFDIEFQDAGNFDDQLAAALDHAKIPVIIATEAQPDGRPDTFAPKVTRPVIFGAVNLMTDKVSRRYPWDINGLPTLAAATVNAIGGSSLRPAHDPFLIRYFGPYERADGHHTYGYLEAASVCKAAMIPNSGPKVGILPEMFRDKIVLIGGTAVGTLDLKASPLSSIYPGVEIHATAIDDLLNGQMVQQAGPFNAAMATLIAAMIAAVGVILPRGVVLKTMFALIAATMLVVFSVAIFTGHTIHWLPMASPIVALVITTVGAFAWSYLTEDRQRRFVLKALSQYLSPDVAAEISRNPDSLKLGGERREMTVLFSDIQGFTDLSESMPSEKLSTVLNYYLGEMSGIILKENGTLDKYIGDAIMSFWNAPLLQADHAVLACRAALAMRDRELQIQAELAKLGAQGLLTRIGINTGPMVVGNMGSAQKFNYSVLGDSVNLGSRLEGANKFYGSRILISETTARLVKDQFALRQLDVLRVKGKQKPLAVFELLADGKAGVELAGRIEGYERAFSHYQAQKWNEADAILSDLQSRYADDLPIAALRKRIAKLRHDPPPQSWDGVYVAKDK